MLERRDLLFCLPLVVALSAGFAAADAPARQPAPATQPASTQPTSTQPAAPLEKLEGFANVETAVTTQLQQASPTLPQAGYLGIEAGDCSPTQP